MRCRPRGAAEDCCQTAILDKLNYIMSRVDSMATAVRVNGQTSYPDGNGLIDLGDIGGVDAEIIDQGTYYTLEITSIR